MAYFSNGTEGDSYEERYCNRCIHDVGQSCRIWLLHLKHNGDDSWKLVLDTLIPQTPDGLDNEECRAFEPLP